MERLNLEETEEGALAWPVSGTLQHKLWVYEWEIILMLDLTSTKNIPTSPINAILRQDSHAPPRPRSFRITDHRSPVHHSRKFLPRPLGPLLL